MNINIWCKSFLSIYNLIPTIISSIDRIVLLRGIKSSDFGLSGKNNTFNQANSILSLMQKKIGFLNLKILTDETLIEMDNLKSKVLLLRYIDNISNKDIIETMNLSRRSYFRMLSSSLKEFESIFYRKIQNKNFYLDSANESFLDDIFIKINNFKKRNEDLSFEEQGLGENICNFIVNRMKKVI